MGRYKTVDINVAELRNWLKHHHVETGENFGKVAENIGKSKCYWSSVMNQGRMPENIYKYKMAEQKRFEDEMSM